jgi:hypothetical protein
MKTRGFPDGSPALRFGRRLNQGATKAITTKNTKKDALLFVLLAAKAFSLQF